MLCLEQQCNDNNTVVKSYQIWLLRNSKTVKDN